MKTSEILRLTKQGLSKKELHGVCTAMWSTCVAPYKDLQRVQKMIDERIGGSGYATYWLAFEVLFGNKKRLPKHWFLTRTQWVKAQKPKDLQAWRHRWVASMITEFKAKGD